MIRSLAVGLTAATLLVSSWGRCARPLRLDIDDCVDADRKEVLRLLEVELGAAVDAGGEASVAEGPTPALMITCTAERDVVEVKDPAQPGARPRVLDLRALGAEARRARARELVLVIREMLEARSDEPPVNAKATRRVTQPKLERSRSIAELALLGGAEKYSGGYAHLGVALGFRVRPLSLLVVEARGGVRMSPTLSAPAGEIVTKGLTGAFGVGVDLFPTEGSAGLVVLTRLQADWVSIEGKSDLEGSVGRSADGWALVGSLASSAWVALGPHWRLTLEPALLLPIQELTIVDRGRPISSLAGLGAAASIGVAVRL